MLAWLWICTLNMLGWLGLCLGLPQNSQARADARPHNTKQWLYRTGGWLTTLTAAAIAVSIYGWSLGLVGWSGLWMLSALAWSLLYNASPAWARNLTWLLVLGAVLASLKAIAP